LNFAQNKTCKRTLICRLQRMACHIVFIGRLNFQTFVSPTLGPSLLTVHSKECGWWLFYRENIASQRCCDQVTKIKISTFSWLFL